MEYGSPFRIFKEWYETELRSSPEKVPSAVCLSTKGQDGYPNSRFVSLKEIKNETFVFTGPLNSRKGLEIMLDNKVGLAFWWTTTERQIRIQGEAYQITEQEADTYFNERERDSQIVSCVSEQGKPLADHEYLYKKYEQKKTEQKDKTILRPENWGGFYVVPARIEFMEFKVTRFHHRILFQKENGLWKNELLQP